MYVQVQASPPPTPRLKVLIKIVIVSVSTIYLVSVRLGESPSWPAVPAVAASRMVGGGRLHRTRQVGCCFDRQPTRSSSCLCHQAARAVQSPPPPPHCLHSLGRAAHRQSGPHHVVPGHSASRRSSLLQFASISERQQQHQHVCASASPRTATAATNAHCWVDIV